MLDQGGRIRPKKSPFSSTALFAAEVGTSSSRSCIALRLGYSRYAQGSKQMQREYFQGAFNADCRNHDTAESMGQESHFGRTAEKQGRAYCLRS